MTSAAVVNLAARRAVREQERFSAARSALGLQLSRDAKLETARYALAELQAKHGFLLERLREPLLEMIEWARVAQVINGTAQDYSYKSCVGLVLCDLRHLQAGWDERVDTRRAEIPAAHARFVQMKLL